MGRKKGSPNRRTAEAIPAWIEAYEGGKTAQEIADLWGAEKGTVLKHLRLAGVQIRSSGARKKSIKAAYTVEQAQEWLRRLQVGESSLVVAQSVGISRGTLYNRLRRQGMLPGALPRKGNPTAKYPDLSEKDVARNAAFKRKYRITIEEYKAMVATQGGLCAICERPPQKRQLAVDHDHTTGRIRALLCASCNPALGGFQDDPALLRRAADYLDRHRAIV